jgi:hypothetical protein
MYFCCVASTDSDVTASGTGCVRLRRQQTGLIAWCEFVRASLHMRREEKPSRCHWMLYCTHDTLNMFRVLLCPSSGALDYMCVFAAYGVQCLVAGCRGSGAGQQGVRPGWGMLHDSVVSSNGAPWARPGAMPRGPKWGVRILGPPKKGPRVSCPFLIF